MYDVAVVGGGPIGCFTAKKIAREGFKVVVIEEDPSIGKPVRCTGLVSWRLKELVPDLPEDVILNVVNRARFYPSDLELKSDKPVFVIDRAKLDVELSKRAIEAGADVRTLTKFEGYRRDGFLKVKTNREVLQAKILIGADGSTSQVARSANLDQPDNLLIGMQATVKGEFEPDVVELWFNASPDFFGWVGPLNERWARIGLASKSKCKTYFERFLKERIGRVEKPDVYGTIRYGLMNDTVSDNLLLVGSAACQVKPFSGGGIVYGLIGATFASSACISALEVEDFSSDFLRNSYDIRWKERLGKPIKKGLRLRRVLSFLGSSVSLKLASIFKSRISKWDVDLL